MNYNPTCTDCPSPVDDYYPVSNITWYDAIVFCNKLSFLKGLSPCYSINGETDPDNWIYQNNIEERVVCDWNAKGIVCLMRQNGNMAREAVQSTERNMQEPMIIQNSVIWMDRRYY